MVSNLLLNSVNKAERGVSGHRRYIWRAVGLSGLVHVFVFSLIFEFDRPNFLTSQIHDESPIHFNIGIKRTNGDDLSQEPSESSTESRQLAELAESAEKLEQTTTNTTNATNTFKQPTQTTRPIGHYAASSWGRFHFVNMTEVLFNKTSQFIGQVAPVLTQINFLGKCVMYVGPSDFLVSLQCNAKEEYVSQLLPLIQQNFRLESELTEYWRCIEITNTQISLKEKCDAL